MDDQLVIVAEVANEFEAHAIAGLLEDAGLDPLVSEDPGDNQPLGMPRPVRVMVTPERAEEARQVLAEARAQADRDDIPEEEPMALRGMPVLAKVAFVVALIVVAVTVVGMILMLVI